ncbi:MAG: peptidoglycan-binding protein, partial [Proteobacteria bacterium]|nr:peptidoglycan-binding protein [Pseudomonadota bacterium]
MAFGQNPLYRESKGPEVVELQLRLAGFYGTVWDGDFGPATEYQVMAFQREYMGMAKPTGMVEADTFEAIEWFASE